MSEGVYAYQAEEVISNLTVLYCRTSPEVKTVVNRTLGGFWFTQKVGAAAIRAEVELYAIGMPARDILIDFYTSGELMTIEVDGYKRTGRIISQPSAEMVGRARDITLRKYLLRFSFGVDQEVLA